jgi:hypothetical protein
MSQTGQQLAREMLIGMGIKSAADFSEKSLGTKHERNRKIVAAVIFDGWTLKKAGDTFGVSIEQARVVGLGSVRRLVGQYENLPVVAKEGS